MQFLLTIASKKFWILMEGKHILYVTFGCRGERIESEKLAACVKDILLYLKHFSKHCNYWGRYRLSSILTVLVALGQVVFYLYQLDLCFPFYSTANNNTISPSDVYKWILQPDYERTDPLIKYFPRKVGCDLEYWGPSGTKKFTDLICVVAFNDANEKIHIIGFLLQISLALAITLNFVYTWIAIATLSSTWCTSDTKYAKAYKDLNNDQLFFLLLIRKNVGVNVFEKILEELAATNPTGGKPKPKLNKEGSNRGLDPSNLPI